ncbi:Glyceraldehyde-3-phosphate dehydrogenase [Clonorchis sinensis]|uniref:Glyceraldehyde-3-phosphate dehydrogenase n=2 Tax=Clonorchis sinensis TaxID=79923 RepID=A0A419PSQ3_CLOSI|nr:Glyceraldehyde-3-phosphate dehydrogenase [Clonorchis sinensis]
MMYANWRQFVGDPLMPKEWPRRARIGLNGFGQLARTLLRCALEDNRGLDVVAINEPNLTPEQMIYLLKYDTNLGPFAGYISEHIEVTYAKGDQNGEYSNIQVAGRWIGVFHCKQPEDIPWNWLAVEYVLETTGELRHLKEATKHLTGGRARKVLVAGDTVDIPLLMYPISCRGYQRGTSVVASGSPMAHAVATIVSLVNEICEMEDCMVTLVLPVGDCQNLVDGATKDALNWRLGRAATQSIIPGRCPAVLQSVFQAIPKLNGRLDAITMHVPVFEGAVVDLTFRTMDVLNGVGEVVDRITKNSLLLQYNDLHIKTQPFRDKGSCFSQFKKASSSASSMADSIRRDSDQSLSQSSGPNVVAGTDINPTIQMPDGLTSVLVPVSKEDAYVSSDATIKHTLCLLSVDCCFGIPAGNTFKLVTWFDLGVSYCERLLDTVVFMRSIDHN